MRALYYMKFFQILIFQQKKIWSRPYKHLFFWKIKNCRKESAGKIVYSHNKVSHAHNETIFLNRFLQNRFFLFRFFRESIFMFRFRIDFFKRIENPYHDPTRPKNFFLLLSYSSGSISPLHTHACAFFFLEHSFSLHINQNKR